MFKNALVSVSDKRGLVEFIAPLARQGLRVLSTGGTAQVLKHAGIDVVEIEEQTGFPEVMDGRVKSLHPKIYMPLLARPKHSSDQELLKKENLQAFDLLVCNLYPFESDPRLEQIDVGGPSLLRAGAKNFEQVTVLCDPADYQKILKAGTPPNLQERKLLAAKAFSCLAGYNTCIAKQLEGSFKQQEQGLHLNAGFFKKLRYGENPSQKARWLKIHNKGLHCLNSLQENKDLSYNNICDLQAAVELLRQFPKEKCCTAIKHNNPCGVACAGSLQEAVDLALKADSVSVFGAVLAVNEKVSDKEAVLLSSLFLEVVMAPAFTDSALKILRRKKNLRIIEWPEMMEPSIDSMKLYKVDGGLLVQDSLQPVLSWDKNWRIIGKEPSLDVKKDLLMAWKVCSQLKSNAIALVSNAQTVGLGMGQVSRISALEGAVAHWKKFHSHVQSPVMASDGFFPFSDSIKTAYQNGIQWILQPGGSVRDEEIIREAKKLSISMVFTGRRCFLH